MSKRKCECGLVDCDFLRFGGSDNNARCAERAIAKLRAEVERLTRERGQFAVDGLSALGQAHEALAEVAQPTRERDSAREECARLAKVKDGLAVVEIIHGVAGPCIAINDLRVAGPKPYGGGVSAHRWIIERKQLADALGRALPEWVKTSEGSRR